MPLSISKKINIGISLLIILILLTGSAGFYGVSKMSNILTFIMGDAWDAADGAMEGTIGIQGEMIEISNLLNPYNNTPEDIILKRLNSARELANESLSRMRNTGLIDQDSLHELDNKTAAFEQAINNVLQASKQYQKKLIDKETFTAKQVTYFQKADDLIEFVGELEEIGDSKVEAETKNVAITTQLVDTILITALLLSIISACIIMFLCWKLIALPIRKAADQLRSISEVDGDLTAQLPVRGKDEIADLAIYFNAFVGKIHQTIKKVSDMTNSMYQTTMETSEITEHTFKVVSNQQYETQQVATAATEMTSTVEEVAQNASHAADAATSASTEASNGKQLVSDTRNLINKLANEITHSSTVINGLHTETENIGSVLDVIKGIAEQTNLLALNAAIEAARAGEQGRGFAVVADEVRTLANRTQQSTEEIQTMIESLQQGAKNAVSEMESSKEITTATVEQASNAEESLQHITNLISKISDMNIQISTATEEQSSVTAEINKNITHIKDASDQVTESISETTRANEDLASLAQNLKQLVNQFKI